MSPEEPSVTFEPMSAVVDQHPQANAIEENSPLRSVPSEDSLLGILFSMFFLVFYFFFFTVLIYLGLNELETRYDAELRQRMQYILGRTLPRERLNQFLQPDLELPPLTPECGPVHRMSKYCFLGFFFLKK